MKKQTLMLAVALLFATTAAHAEYQLGNWNASGFVNAGARAVNGSNETHAQFNKFTDRSDGAFGNASVAADNDGSYHLKFDASDIYRKDQEYHLSGGKYANFNYELFYTQIINRRTIEGVKGPWTNPGDSNLTLDPSLNFASNNFDGTGYTPFEYKIERKKTGVTASLFKESPYFLNLSADQEVTKGIRPWGTNPSGSSSYMMNEIPEPLDFKTNTFGISGGYRTDKYIVSADAALSDFVHGLDYLTYQPLAPYATAGIRPNKDGLTDRLMLARDSRYWNGNIKATVYDLPMHSTAMAKVGYSRITSSFDMLLEDILDYDGASKLVKRTLVANNNPNGTFEGLIEYMSGNAAVSSRPTEKLDTKFSYAYLRKKNNSNPVQVMGAKGNVSVFSSPSEQFGFDQHTAGFDVGYQLPMHTKLGVEYEYMRIKRDRTDININNDHKGTLTLKNKSIHWLTPKVKYSYLVRYASFGDVYALKNLTHFMRSDVAAKRQQRAAVGADMAPTDKLDITAEVAYRRTSFPETEADPISGRANQGRTADGTIEANASADYKFSEQIRTSVFGSYETTYKELTNGTTANGTTLGQRVQDVYYMGGANTVVEVIPSKSDVTAGYQYHRGRTRVDGSLVEPLPITGLDAYTKHAVDGNITYKVTKNFKGKLGYIFEQLNYTDPRYDGYTYYSRDTANTGNNYAYTGAFADNSFTAHVGYVTLEYAL